MKDASTQRKDSRRYRNLTIKGDAAEFLEQEAKRLEHSEVWVVESLILKEKKRQLNETIDRLIQRDSELSVLTERKRRPTSKKQ